MNAKRTQWKVLIARKKTAAAGHGHPFLGRVAVLLLCIAMGAKAGAARTEDGSLESDARSRNALRLRAESEASRAAVTARAQGGFEPINQTDMAADELLRY